MSFGKAPIPPPSLLPGDESKGIKFVRELGRGGYGSVYLVYYLFPPAFLLIL